MVGGDGLFSHKNRLKMSTYMLDLSQPEEIWRRMMGKSEVSPPVTVEIVSRGDWRFIDDAELAAMSECLNAFLKEHETVREICVSVVVFLEPAFQTVPPGGGYSVYCWSNNPRSYAPREYTDVILANMPDVHPHIQRIKAVLCPERVESVLRQFPSVTRWRPLCPWDELRETEELRAAVDRLTTIEFAHPVDAAGWCPFQNILHARFHATTTALPDVLAHFPAIETLSIPSAHLSLPEIMAAAPTLRALSIVASDVYLSGAQALQRGLTQCGQLTHLVIRAVCGGDRGDLVGAVLNSIHCLPRLEFLCLLGGADEQTDYTHYRAWRELAPLLPASMRCVVLPDYVQFIRAGVPEDQLGRADTELRRLLGSIIAKSRLARDIPAVSAAARDILL